MFLHHMRSRSWPTYPCGKTFLSPPVVFRCTQGSEHGLVSPSYRHSCFSSLLGGGPLTIPPDDYGELIRRSAVQYPNCWGFVVRTDELLHS
eukprot:95811-Amphidinium_carterae.2